MAEGIQIGALAKQSGLSIDTIRFYERKGLLKQPSRSKGGFRLYSDRELADLNFISKAKDLGFSLAEIRALLVLQDEDTQPCSHVHDLLVRKLKMVQAKLQDLARLESELKRALKKCRQELKKTPASHGKRCPVLEQMEPGRKESRDEN